jgi:hypothetical protein
MNAIAGRTPIVKDRERLLEPEFNFASLAPLLKTAL